MNLIYPNYIVHLGKYYLSQGIDFNIYSSQDSYFDWSKIILSDNLAKKITVSKDETVEISISYETKEWKVFSGIVEKCDNKQFICKDNMIKLKRVLITDAFLNTDAIEIIRLIAEKARMTNVEIQNEVFSRKDKMVIANKNGIEAIKAVNDYWEVEKKFYCKADGTFYWGDQEVNEKIYKFNYGENIISLDNSGTSWKLTTVIAPFIKHSDIININHTKITGNFTINKVRHYINKKGYMRTELNF